MIDVLAIRELAKEALHVSFHVVESFNIGFLDHPHGVVEVDDRFHCKESISLNVEAVLLTDVSAGNRLHQDSLAMT